MIYDSIAYLVYYIFHISFGHVCLRDWGIAMPDAKGGMVIVSCQGIAQ